MLMQGLARSQNSVACMLYNHSPRYCFRFSPSAAATGN